MLFVPVDSAIDSCKHTCLATIRHKHKDNVIIETHCNNALNKIIDPNNNKNFYCAELKEFIGIVVHACSFMAD